MSKNVTAPGHRWNCNWKAINNQKHDMPLLLKFITYAFLYSISLTVLILKQLEN